MINSRFLGLGLAAVTLLGSAAHPAAAQTLLSDNFNAENGGSPQLSYTGFANFNAGNEDLVGNGFFDYLPGNGLYVDLAGSGPGVFQSKTEFTLDPGVYELTFDLSNPLRPGYDTTGDNATVSLGSVYSETFALPVADTFTTFTRDITVLSPTAGFLSFTENNNTVAGDYLDNVQLTKVSAPVPEASTTASLGLLLALGMGGVVARRKKAQA